MTHVAPSGSVIKPKMVCGLGGCSKGYATKGYLKVHKRTKHNVQQDNNDTIADAVDENDIDEEVEETDSIEEALNGGTQILLNYIENEIIDEAREVETEYFDNFDEILGENVNLMTMVAHMVTPALFVKEVARTVVIQTKEKKTEKPN